MVVVRGEIESTVIQDFVDGAGGANIVPQYFPKIGCLRDHVTLL